MRSAAGVASQPERERAGPAELTFLANPKYAHRVKDCRAAAILVSEPVTKVSICSLVSSNPYLDFARALELFYQPPRPAPGVSRRLFGAVNGCLLTMTARVLTILVRLSCEVVGQ